MLARKPERPLYSDNWRIVEMRRQMISTSLGEVPIVIFAVRTTTDQTFPGFLSYSTIAPLDVKIIVFPLEELRKDSKLIGRRTHFFGKVDTFKIEVPLGERISTLLVEVLKQKGWDAKMASPGIGAEDITSDWVVTGKIRRLWAEATSHLGYTQIGKSVDLDIVIIDHQTSVKTKFNLKEEDAPKVVFFQNSLFQNYLNEIVSNCLNHTQVIKP
jgi:hypothetical protein